MRKISTNSRASSKAPPRKVELPLDLSGAHITASASSAHRLYQALCRTIVEGLVKPGEPLPPSRALAKQTGFRRNAVVTAYERLISDGFAEATVGSGTYVAARIPSRANDSHKAKIVVDAPRRGALALGCTLIDERSLQRFRGFVGRRMRAFGTEHLHYGDPRGSRELRVAIADHLLSARGLRCDPDQIMLTSGTLHALRIVLGAIAPVPYRAVAAERKLTGRPLTPEVIATAAQAWAPQAHPLPGNAWKVEAACAVLRRTLEDCLLADRDPR